MKKMNYRTRFFLYFFFSAILFFSCRERKLTKEKLISFISHSKELDQSSEIKGIKTELRLIPYQMMVLQELDGGKRNDSSFIHELEKRYSSQYYFRLAFSEGNQEVIRQLGSFQSYSDMVQVLSFEMSKYIFASNEKSDTMPLVDYIFERDYGMSSSNNLLLVFKKADFIKSEEININIGEFGLGVGSQKFVFRHNDIDDVPSLAGYEPAE